MSITSHYYGRTQNGEEIYQYILENAAGMRVAVIEYGCVITNIWVKDNTGELRDVALGYSKLEDYELPRKCTRAASWTAAWCCGQ